MPGDSAGWEIDMGYLHKIEQDGGFLVDHVPKIGEQNLEVHDHRGERFHLIYQVEGVRRVADDGMSLELHLVEFPIPILVRLADRRLAVPIAAPSEGAVQPAFFRRRSSQPSTERAAQCQPAPSLGAQRPAIPDLSGHNLAGADYVHST